MLLSLAWAATESCDGVHGLSVGRGLGGCLGFVLPQETMLRSVAHVDALDHVDVHGLCYHQKPCVCP